jgi:hypothetical protein
MSATQINKASKDLFVIVAVLFVLYLTAINISNIFKPKENVLGVETQENTDQEFWEDFLTKHPNYIPGWVEIGRTDKVKQLDPNFLLYRP